MPIVIKTSDGGVAVMTLVEASDSTAEIAKWVEANPGIYVSHVEIPDEDMPTDRSLRHAWVLSADNKISIDPDRIASNAVPKVVSRAQFILALLQLDLLDEVEAAIAAADRATQINYKERLEFDRNHPLVATMAAAMGKTDAEIDALFTLAATL